MKILESQREALNQLGYFENATGDFVCNLVGCNSRISLSDNKYLFVTCATNTCSIACVPSFSKLTDKILHLQNSCGLYEYVRQSNNNTYICCSSYIIAKSKDKKSSRKASENLLRVRSSNVWSYGYDIPTGENIGTLYVQFKGRRGGPGDIYQYLYVPVKVWQKFLSAPSKGHFFWKYVRNRFKYRKLTGDKKGKLANALN